MQAVELEKLRLLLSASAVRSERHFVPCPDFSPGIPRGAITELSGFGKTEWLVRLFAREPDLRAAWIEEKFSIFPSAVLGRNVNSKQILYIRPGAELLWAVRQIVKSQLFPFVVVAVSAIAEKELRGWQIAVERAGVALILLRDKAEKAWPIALQVEISRISKKQDLFESAPNLLMESSDFYVRVLRQKL